VFWCFSGFYFRKKGEKTLAFAAARLSLEPFALVSILTLVSFGRLGIWRVFVIPPAG
jgi:hypothetical protein